MNDAVVSELLFKTAVLQLAVQLKVHFDGAFVVKAVPY